MVFIYTNNQMNELVVFVHVRRKRKKQKDVVGVTKAGREYL